MPRARQQTERFLNSLGGLRLPGDVVKVLDAPFPTTDALDQLSAERHQRLVTQVIGVVGPMLTGDVTADDLALAAGSRGEDPSAVWDEALYVLTSWWASALFSAVKRHPQHHPSTSWGITTVLEAIRDAPNQPPHVAGAHSLYAYFGMLLVYSQLVETLRRWASAPASLERTVSHLLHDALLRVWRIRTFPRLAKTAEFLVGLSVALLPDIYESDVVGDDELSGPFGSINLTDFVRIARRDERVVKKYGERVVPRIFEQQLALIMQSLGALVVHTRPGDRTVDLYCIPMGTSSPFSFLVEAKTSRRPYGLPVKDQRALLEYIQQTNRLRTLPPLRFVLVVAAEPAGVLPQRMRELEGRARVPIRFISTKGLARLRAAVVGPASFDETAELAIDGPACLPDEFGDQIVSLMKRQQAAHENLVRAVLGLDNKGGDARTVVRGAR